MYYNKRKLEKIWMEGKVSGGASSQAIRDYRLDNALELEARNVIDQTRQRFNAYKNMLGRGHDEEWLRRLRRERAELLRVYRFEDFFKKEK